MLFALLAAAVGTGFLIRKVHIDGVLKLKGRADEIIAPLVSRAADGDRSSGCVSGRTEIYFDGAFDRYARDCLLECTPVCLCCVTLVAGEPCRQYTVPLDSITQCKVREYTKEYRITLNASGRKSIFVVHKRSPRDIIPMQGERAEKFIEILCKAAGLDNLPHKE